MKSIYTVVLCLVLGMSTCFGQDTIVVFNKDKVWGIMNINGKVLKEGDIFEKANLQFQNGLSRIDKLRFLDTSGNVFNVNDYGVLIVKSREFYDGLLAVKVANKWGFMNSKGQIVIQPIYNQATDFDGGLAVVKKKKEYLILDITGKETTVISNNKKVTHMKKFSEGLAAIEIENQLWGFVNGKGEIVVDAQYKSTGYFKKGLVWVKLKNNLKVGYIDQSGTWKIEPIFKAGSNFDIVSGLARVDNGGWKYVNTNGEVFDFEENKDNYKFYDGMLMNTEGDLHPRYGFLDKNGEWAVKPIYGYVNRFQNGYSVVRYKNKWGLINKKGEWVLKPEYNYLKKRVSVLD